MKNYIFIENWNGEDHFFQHFFCLFLIFQTFELLSKSLLLNFYWIKNLNLLKIEIFLCLTEVLKLFEETKFYGKLYDNQFKKCVFFETANLEILYNVDFFHLLKTA